MPPQEKTGICNSVRPKRRYFMRPTINQEHYFEQWQSTCGILELGLATSVQLLGLVLDCASCDVTRWGQMPVVLLLFTPADQCRPNHDQHDASPAEPGDFLVANEF